MRVRVVLILAVLASTGIRLTAHDFWLAATPRQPESRVVDTPPTFYVSHILSC
jgi:hypothetical protein